MKNIITIVLCMCLPISSDLYSSWLNAAIKSGKIEKVLYLLTEDKRRRLSPSEMVLKTDSQGCNSFHYAAKYGTDQIMNVLIGVNAEGLLQENNAGQLPIHEAAHRNNLSVVQLLAKNKEVLTLQNTYGNTVLHEAFDSGSLEVSDYLIDNHPELLYIKNHNKELPIHIASMLEGKGSSEAIRKQLEINKDLSFKVNDDNVPPLSYAIQGCSESAISILYGANPDAINYEHCNGDTVYHDIAACNDPETLDFFYSIDKNKDRFFYRNNNGESPFLTACYSGNIKVARKLYSLDNKSHMITNLKGNTALHLACKDGYAKIIDFLVSIDRNLLWKKNYKGQLPVHVAAKFGCDQIVQKIVDIDPSFLDTQDNKGFSLAHHASLNGNLEIAQLCIKQNLNLFMSSDNDDNLPLFFAIMHDHTDYVKTIIKDNPLFAMITNRDGNTLMHIAALSGNIPIMQDLSSIHPKWRCPQNKFGETPLHFAAVKGNTDTIKYALPYLTLDEIYQKNSHGETAYDLAKEHSHSAIVEAIDNNLSQRLR